MWAKIVFTHPSIRRFRTVVSLSGNVLQQELTGTQTRTVSGMGCTMREYNTLVREAEDTEFVEGLQFSASEMVHPGIECLQVDGSGTRKLPVGETDDGSYVYTPGQCT